MVRAHRQAWAWQDEWHGLTMEDIREIERQTQLALKKKMGLSESGDEEGIIALQINNSKFQLKYFVFFFFLELSVSEDSKTDLQIDNNIEATKQSTTSSTTKIQPPIVKEHPPSIEISSDEENDEVDDNLRDRYYLIYKWHKNIFLFVNFFFFFRSESVQLSKSKYGSKGALHSPVGSHHSFDLQVSCCFFVVLSVIMVQLYLSVYCNTINLRFS